MANQVVLLLQLVVVFIFIELLHTSSWTDRPLFPSQQIPDDGLSPQRSVVRRKIVLYHNFFRTKVSPKASDMLLMSWHPESARLAQKYAEKCVFLEHSDPKENTVPHLGTCGQNLFVAEQKVPWFFALKSWFSEYQNFTYGRPSHDFKAIGHYTQMVWATSHKVGCGIAYCAGGKWGHFYNYVCHYCPGGNIGDHYYYPYKAGTPCADCPDHCISGSLCSNTCGHLNMYSNCDSLVEQTNRDVCQQGVCNASCLCSDKIYKNYPWY